jgi:alcohol dehydrogenase (cytochrome c)
VPFSTERETRFCPGVQGGVEWNGPAYHPGLGLLYVNAIDWCTLVRMQPTARIKGTPGAPWTGAEPPMDGCSAAMIPWSSGRDG